MLKWYYLLRVYETDVLEIPKKKLKSYYLNIYT
jgi:hypothetical protein